MTNDPERGDAQPPASPLRRIAALVLPAAIGAGVALGVVGATVGFGGDTTTIIREGGSTIVASAPAESSRVAEAPKSEGALSVTQLVKRESPAVVLVTTSGGEGGGGLGSGFLIDRRGHILTNAHVVDGGEQTSVTFSDGTVEKAKVLGVDNSTDLAVLKVAEVPTGVNPAPLGSSAGLVVGQEVVAIGNPYGLERTATTGIVSALKRSIESPNDFTIQNAIQTDAAINQGNSGGPLYDMAGRVVGMNTQIASQNGGNVGIGFAVPIDTIKPIAEAVINKGTVQHAWIGITGRELTPALAEKLGLEGRRGVLVTETVPGSAAREEGLDAADDPKAEVPRGADLIVAVNGRRVVDMADVSQAIASRRVGEKVTITVLRDGRERTVTLTLKDRPSGMGVR
jgi:S1-C subfamily serine protease